MLDDVDKKLLAALQRHANSTAQELSDALNMSASQVGRRRQRLETEGYITSYRAHLDAQQIGLSVQAFVQVQLSSHGPEQASSFARLIELQSEITSAWTLTGDADYLLRIYCYDLSALNSLIHDIILPHPAVARVQSQIVMDQLKQDAPLPT
ncbi:Lrp/AsnC family transcriptional regulator [Planktotalea sp.]|uniref:Lrp/AsnC family transcriptional regulator n=1 Tax=Planktotalea sp. TaxID=2029877 RepID=UPI0032986E4A